MTTHTVDITPNYDNLVEHYSRAMQMSVEDAVRSWKQYRYLKAVKLLYDAFHSTYIALCSCTSVEHIQKLRDRMNESVELFHTFIKDKR